MAKNVNLTEGSVTKALVKFAVPVFFASCLQMVYSTTDILIAGRFATTADVAGVSMGSQIMSLITLGMSGISLGVTVVMGKRYGAKDQEGVKKSVGTGTAFFLILALCLLVPLLVLNHPIVSAMNTPVESITQSRQYLFYCTLGIPFIMGYNLSSSILRGLGNSKMPLVFVACSCTVNIILDLLLIGRFHMGAAGAAIATCVSQGISLVLSATYLKKRGFDFDISLRDIRISREYLREILKVGIPQAIQEVLVTLSFLIITALVNRMGLNSAAAVGITEKLICYTMLPAIAATSAVATMTSHNIGAGKPERAEKALWIGVVICFIFGAVMHVLAQFFGEWFAGIFTPDADVAYLASLYISTYTIDCLFTAYVFPANSYFAACGHSMFVMIQMLATTFFVRVPVVVWMVNVENTSLKLVGLGAPASSFASIVVCLIFMYRLKKKKTAENSEILTV